MSRTKNDNRIVRVKRGNGKAEHSTVRGVRLDDYLWDLIGEKAYRERKTRNAFVAEILKSYLESENGRE